MLKSDGTKFGKSTGGAVWFKIEKQLPYNFTVLVQHECDVISAIKVLHS